MFMLIITQDSTNFKADHFNIMNEEKPAAKCHNSDNFLGNSYPNQWFSCVEKRQRTERGSTVNTRI